MANGINNKYEYRSGLLDSLNVQHTASDVRNEDEYRKKVLNGLGVEYTEDDINQKNLYRAKVVEGLASSEGGGGTKYETVFEGNVTTHDDDGEIFGIIENLTLNGNSIRVTFNGTVFELPKTEHGYGAENESGIDFRTYPLFIATGGGLDSCTLWTLTPGTYSLKIEEPQSGGESDFSTAEVTYRLTFEALEEEETSVRFMPPVAIANNEITIGSSYIPVEDIPQGSTSVDIKCSTPLYKNKTTVVVGILAMATGTSKYVYQGGPITATGNATITGGAIANITGDCVITIPVGLRN